MKELQLEAIRWLQNTERYYYQGTDRREMKLALKRYTEEFERVLLECAPLFAGLVLSTAWRLLDECPDYV